MVANASLRIDEIERRPVSVGKSVPYRKVVIDGDGIVDAHALGGAAHVIDVVLERKLGSVHADHHQPLILVFLGPGANIGQRAQPVDARIRPDVEHDHLSAEPIRRQGRRIQPRGRSVKRGDFTFDGQSNCCRRLRHVLVLSENLERCRDRAREHRGEDEVVCFHDRSLPPNHVEHQPSASSTALAKACGASCGKLCPIPPPMSRCEYLPENLLA